MIRKIERRSTKAEGGLGIVITLSSGDSHFISSDTLRRACPCAHCLESKGESNHSKPLSTAKTSRLQVIQASATESLDLEKIWILGNYALGIRWADGHDTGIYSFSDIEKLIETPLNP